MSIYLTPDEAAAIARALEVLDGIEERARKESYSEFHYPEAGRITETAKLAGMLLFEVANVAKAHLNCRNANEIIETKHTRTMARLQGEPVPPYRFRSLDVVETTSIKVQVPDAS